MPIDTYQHQVPLDQQNARQAEEFAPGYYPHASFEADYQVQLSDRDIEEQATPESVRAGLIDLYDDRSNLNYLQDGQQEPVTHEGVAGAEQAQSTAELQVDQYDHRPWMETLGDAGIVRDIASVTPSIVFRRNEAQRLANQ